MNTATSLLPGLSHDFPHSNFEVRLITNLLSQAGQKRGVEQDLKRFHRDPFGFSCLYQGQSLIGTVSLWPVSDRWSQALREGAHSGEEVNPDSDIVSPRRPAPQSWYLTDFAIDKVVDDEGARFFLREVLLSWFWRIKAYPVILIVDARNPFLSALATELGFEQVEGASSPTLLERTFMSREQISEEIRKWAKGPLAVEEAAQQYALPA